jgi:hypothetical protein
MNLDRERERAEYCAEYCAEHCTVLLVDSFVDSPTCLYDVTKEPRSQIDRYYFVPVTLPPCVHPASVQHPCLANQEG